MTTTNVYQGMHGKNSSRVLQAPGGGSSNIFGHYQDEEQQNKQERRQRENETVAANLARGGPSGDPQHNFMDNKDSFAANRNRNHGAGAPFATSDQMVTGQAERSAHHQQVVGADYETPQQRQAANKSRNQGNGAPFATGDNSVPSERSDRPAHNQQQVGSDYQSPQQRQANNPNKAGNSFSNLFGDSSPEDHHNSKAKGKVSTHNPVTWEAYSNFDAGKDQPAHKSRFENFAGTKAGTHNPITGEEHAAPPASSHHPSTRVHAPPGGKSSIQF